MVISFNIIFPIVFFLLAAIIVAAVVFLLRRMISQQIKLHNCISLVELKSNKIRYYICFGLCFLPMIYAVMSIVDIRDGLSDFYVRLDISKVSVVLVMVAVMIIFLSLAALMFVLSYSKCALVDKGVYTQVHFFEWYQIYDYYVDEKRNCVILSRDRRGVYSFKGMSVPLRFRKEDIEKLKFILNRNKNKFLTEWELR